jgi:hypothetical protein
MTTEADFQRHLDLNIDDWQTRLILADWLEDRDDVRSSGYRELGRLRIVPRGTVMDGRGDYIRWIYGTVRNTNWRPHDPDEWTINHVGMMLPNKWFVALFEVENPAPAPDSARDCWARYTRRRNAEDGAARAFYSLPPAQRAAIHAMESIG